MRPNSDEVFGTREEAEALRDRLNEEPPEWGYSPWYLASHSDEERREWWVMRSRGVIAEDLDVSASEYEQAFQAHIEAMARNRDGWRDLDGIEIEEVFLDGAYPHTRIAVVFRAVPSPRVRFGQPTDNCRFGYRVRIWPAGYADPSREASFWDQYFHEFLGTNPAGYGPLRGLTPCDPTRINWLRD